jgi:FkbM family methyltransferase
MKFLDKTIDTSDFIPPIIPKAMRFLKNHSARGSNGVRMHPFNHVPGALGVDWILDVGANKGEVASAALKSYPGCRVICFEPVDSTFKILKDNLALFGDRAILFKSALGDETGTAEINLTSFHGANSIMPQSGFHKFFNPHVSEIGTEKISIVRLDEVASEFPTKYIDIMKIDVEGFELNVLKGGTRFISSSVDTIIIEVSLMRDINWDQQSIFEIFNILKGMGFCLINIIDLHHSNNSDMMLVQMDCIFRHRSKLRGPS